MDERKNEGLNFDEFDGIFDDEMGKEPSVDPTENVKENMSGFELGSKTQVKDGEFVPKTVTAMDYEMLLHDIEDFKDKYTLNLDFAISNNLDQLAENCISKITLMKRILKEKAYDTQEYSEAAENYFKIDEEFKKIKRSIHKNKMEKQEFNNNESNASQVAEPNDSNHIPAISTQRRYYGLLNNYNNRLKTYKYHVAKLYSVQKLHEEGKVEYEKYYQFIEPINNMHKLLKEDYKKIVELRNQLVHYNSLPNEQLDSKINELQIVKRFLNDWINNDDVEDNIKSNYISKMNSIDKQVEIIDGVKYDRSDGYVTDFEMPEPPRMAMFVLEDEIESEPPVIPEIPVPEDDTYEPPVIPEVPMPQNEEETLPQNLNSYDNKKTIKNPFIQLGHFFGAIGYNIAGLFTSKFQKKQKALNSGYSSINGQGNYSTKSSQKPTKDGPYILGKNGEKLEYVPNNDYKESLQYYKGTKESTKDGPYILGKNGEKLEYVPNNDYKKSLQYYKGTKEPTKDGPYILGKNGEKLEYVPNNAYKESLKYYKKIDTPTYAVPKQVKKSPLKSSMTPSDERT